MKKVEMFLNLDPEELTRIAARIFGPGAEPLPGFGEAARAALRELREREKTVFLQRLEGKTLEEIGKELDITRERVRQIEARAIRRLRWRTIKYVSTELPPSTAPLSVEDIEGLLAHASRDQREAWREFRSTFSPEQAALWREYWRIKNDKEKRALVWGDFTTSLTDEQRALWRAYRRASAYTKKVRAAARRAREGKEVYAL